MLSMVHGREGLGQVPVDNVRDLVAFMRQWEHPRTWRQTRRITEMSTRAIHAGQALYTTYCASCHGPQGGGPGDGPEYYAPALNNAEFLHAASDGFLLATIARGRVNTPMRAFGVGAEGIAELRSEEISDIVSFIRSWQEPQPELSDAQTRDSRFGGNSYEETTAAMH
jgi:cytochrome c oxidase cbb3-type subunit 3